MEANKILRSSNNKIDDNHMLIVYNKLLIKLLQKTSHKILDKENLMKCTPNYQENKMGHFTCLLNALVKWSDKALAVIINIDRIS